MENTCPDSLPNPLENRVKWAPSPQDQLRTRSIMAEIRALPRTFLGIAILRALGMQLPAPPVPKGSVDPRLIAQTNARLAQIRAELAAEAAAEELPVEEAPGPHSILKASSAVGVDLAEQTTRAEAQRMFEASQLRPRE